MGPSIVIIIWGGIALIGAAIFIFAMVADKKRQEAIQKLATDLGLEYLESLSTEDNEQFSHFTLANQGRSRQSTNVIVADSGDLRMTIFDYRFTTGSGRNSSTHRQTVVLIRSQTLHLPEFSIGPESVFHRLGEFLGMNDIDFDDDPEFSRKFLLRGPDEAAVREFFSLERRGNFKQHHGISIEARDSHFIFYQARQRRNVDQIKGLMEQAFSIYRLLT